MAKTIRKKKEGFVLEITSEVADILGVSKQDDVRIGMKDSEESRNLTNKLIKQFYPVLEKLAKT